MKTQIERLGEAITSAKGRIAKLEVEVSEWRSVTQHKFICATRIGKGAWRYESHNSIAEVIEFVSSL